MKTTMKAAFAAALLGAAAIATAPADARSHVNIGIGIGVPGPVYADPCYGPYPYPAYCGYPVYYGPVVYGGVIYERPRYRVVNGQRVFFVRGGWRHARPHHGHHRW